MNTVDFNETLAQMRTCGQSPEGVRIDPENVRRVISLFSSAVFPGYFDDSPQNLILWELFYKIKVLSESAGVAGEEQEELARRFIEMLPDLKASLWSDVKAVFDADPAAKSPDEIILCYPSVTAMLHYRLAHALLLLGMPLVPRIITETAHSETGIDIHPGAAIGNYFSIDHGTGVVIGETAIVGHHVRIYQGVTLGAKSFRHDENGKAISGPRHPIIEDNVTIYSNSSILGRITIGHDSVIGGNVWQTESLPPFSRVVQGKSVATHFTDGGGI